MLLTRSSTGASELRICSRGLPPKSSAVSVSERHGVPAMSIVAKPSSSGTSGGWAGTSPAWLGDLVAVGDLRERAAAAQQGSARPWRRP